MAFITIGETGQDCCIKGRNNAYNSTLFKTEILQIVLFVWLSIAILSKLL